MHLKFSGAPLFFCPEFLKFRHFLRLPDEEVLVMGKKKQPDSSPLTQQEIRVNMKTFAAFMARMIEKYGDEVLEEIEVERAAKQAADSSAAEEAGS